MVAPTDAAAVATVAAAVAATTGQPFCEEPARSPQRPMPVKPPDSDSGDGNSGDGNSGDGNSGDGNSGDGNSGDGNSGDDGSDGDDVQNESHNGKRKRPISVSCELCKVRKVKCDRAQPACGWCSRNGAACEYKERKKPGLRAGYGRELEARLDKLEAVLRKHSEALQIPFDLLTANTTAVAKTPQAEVALFLPTSTFPANGVSYAAASGFSPSQQTHPSPLSTAAAREYYGASAPPASPAPVGAGKMDTPPAAAPAGATFTVGASAASPAMGPCSLTSTPYDQDVLPPYDLSYALVDLYFKHINSWCPLLQRNPTIDALFGPSTPDETNQILLHAIVATTLRFSTDARLTEAKRQRYHDFAKQRVLLYGMENMSVKALQALVILALDFCGSSHGPPGWNIMALITRAVVQLGLAVESNSYSVSPGYTSISTLRATILAEPHDFVEEESRRRLFWVIYLLDRYATIATAFAFALDDRDIDRTLPCRDDLWAKNKKVETRRLHTTYLEEAVGGGAVGPAGVSAGTAVGVAADGFEPPTTMGSDGSGTGTATAVNNSANDGSGDGSRNCSGGAGGGSNANLGAFSYYIEILGILTQIHNFLKQPVDISSLGDVEQWQMRYRALDRMLDTWRLGLPGEYGNTAKLFQPNCARLVNGGWVMLHVTYHTAIIRLHSSSAYPTARSPIFRPSYAASQRCHTAVEHIATLCEFAVAHQLLPRLGPPFAFSLWVAARLCLVHGSTVEHKLSPRVAFFVDTLRAMGRDWPVAGQYCALLQRVLDEHRASQRQGDGVTPGSVKILADMRRTAFDLVLLMSRQPRHGLATDGASSASGNSHAMAAGANGANGADDTGGAAGLDGHNGAVNQATGQYSSHPTLARTPQANDLEYLDVFDFFNMPRLPFGLPTEMSAVDGDGSGGTSTDTDGVADGPAVVTFANEVNLADFMVDASRDWLLYKRQGGDKFLA